jgi:large subunit ribosomal protein L13
MKETTMRHMLEKKPEEVLYRAIKGMIHKNKLREDVIRRRLMIYPGPFHPHFSKGLP